MSLFICTAVPPGERAHGPEQIPSPGSLASGRIPPGAGTGTRPPTPETWQEHNYRRPAENPF